MEVPSSNVIGALSTVGTPFGKSLLFYYTILLIRADTEILNNTNVVVPLMVKIV